MLIEAWKPIWAGGQVHVWELANQLVDNHNCSVDVYVMHLKGKNLKKTEQYKKGKLSIIRVGKPCRFTFINRLRWCRQVYKTVKKTHLEKKYDLIHAHANLPGLPGKWLSSKLNIPVVYTVHGSGLQAIKDMYSSPLASQLIYMMEKYLQTGVRYSHEITVDSSFLKQKNKNKHISVIPNGVNPDKFKKMKTQKRKKKTFLFVGRLHPQKGLAYLIKAVAGIQKKLKNTEFRLLGTGPEEKDLKALVKASKTQKLITFTGPKYGKELVEEYLSAHIFVLPSLYEGQPLTLLEAWAAKLPVIATDVGGNKDFIRGGINGHLIPAKNIPALQKAILKTVRMDAERLSRQGNKGYQEVKKKYTWKNVAEQTLAIYRRVRNKKINKTTK